MRFEGRVVLVTGASCGIGKEIAKGFAREGAVVGVNYLSNDEAALNLKREIEEFRGEAHLFKADITDSSMVKDMVRELYSKHNKIDILVNNAGVIKDNLILNMEEREWDKVIEVNLRSVFLVTKAVARYMMMKKFGRIINISSIAAIRGGKGHVNYAASKGGINSFTKSLAVELASKNITVNAVSPGIINTEMSKDILEMAKKELLQRIPLNRIGEPEEVAKTVLFLASSDASYITGEIINVTGGLNV